MYKVINYHSYVQKSMIIFVGQLHMQSYGKEFLPFLNLLSRIFKTSLVNAYASILNEMDNVIYIVV